MMMHRKGPIPQDAVLRPKEGREVLFAAQVGSYNYNLQTEESDEDFVIFTFPRYTDLYDRVVYSTQTVDEKNDWAIHDIRMLPDMLWNANPNSLEILFSKDIRTNSRMEYMEGAETYRLMDLPMLLSERRDRIAKMNLPHLWNSATGVVRSELKRLKGHEDQKQTQKHGYNTKAAMHAVRQINLLRTFAESGFSDFDSALTYSGQRRQDMLDIRNGALTYVEAKDVIETGLSTLEDRWMEKYQSARPDESMYNLLGKMVYETVRIYSLYELDRDVTWK